jgi:hypothetical protein
VSLLEYSAEEDARLAAADERYGSAYINAYNVTILLSDLVLWPTLPIDLFLRFYSQVKKYHTLSVVSPSACTGSRPRWTCATALSRRYMPPTRWHTRNEHLHRS